MTSYEHGKIAKTILEIDTPPEDSTAFGHWIRAEAHLDLLERNAKSSERIIYASGPYTFIHSIAVPFDALAADTPESLLGWNDNPFTSIASYVSGGGRETLRVERGDRARGSPALNAGTDLLFVREFEGWSGPDRVYAELNQEYAHLADIHWRSERNAYCRYDRNGDLVDIVSVTIPKPVNGVALVSFSWPELEEYLSIARMALVRMFDFTLLRYGQFSGWDEGPDDVVRRSDDLIYRQKISGNSAYTRGVQIIRPRDARKVGGEISGRWSGGVKHEHVTFTVQDWRHECQIADISTDPASTTNYFEAENNDLPYEMSPAFFRPEVLSKYKTDREKYTVGDRDISCRAAWTLRAYDVNEAGQVFAYLVYLRALPYEEQLHWKSFNQPPRAGISERAFINDFKGEFVHFQHPRSEILSILQRWRALEISWWKLRDEGLLNRANPPISSSKDEWADAIMDLTQLVVEGFETKALRAILKKLGVPYTDEKTIALLEKIVSAKNPVGGPVQLEGLRTAQHIRSKVKGHAGSTEGLSLARNALAGYGTYADHFKHLCSLIASDLEQIEVTLGR
ncbi:hypothetical protein OSH11_22455 [Kaistia dalseonensis]|uniref:ApeA N-terminal domain-containing protein n=1 Tax=Kaistia dalseonensis TaxID=410840 RepID=A0ABU0HCU0_9HYPH|nr:hypothetical protein [Kaistia dalseonensis]MCX5497478.1 hypothetical protein [Kaistia dalseonensis]MDQ0440117.1 hypothetical protein [Kaistia dalseonensis]